MKYTVEVDEKGSVFFFKENTTILHRENGPAVEWANGDKEYHTNGDLNRLDGPAIEHRTGKKQWWVNGKRHNENGPAITFTDGTVEYWLNGKYYYLKSDWEEELNNINNISNKQEELLDNYIVLNGKKYKLVEIE
jgi:hypothetical protein